MVHRPPSVILKILEWRPTPHLDGLWSCYARCMGHLIRWLFMPIAEAFDITHETQVTLDLHVTPPSLEVG